MHPNIFVLILVSNGKAHQGLNPSSSQSCFPCRSIKESQLQVLKSKTLSSLRRMSKYDNYGNQKCGVAQETFLKNAYELYLEVKWSTRGR